jgi:hypothetical protein
MKTFITFIGIIFLQGTVFSQAGSGESKTLKWLDVKQQEYNPGKRSGNSGVIIYKDSAFQKSKEIVIAALPFASSENVVPVKVKFDSKGLYTFRLKKDLTIPPNYCVYIQDLLNFTYFDLKSSSTLTLNITDTTKTFAFLLFINKPSKQSVAPSSSYSQDGKAILSTVVSGNWNYIWKDASGKTLKVHANSNKSDTLDNIAPGIYYITALSKNKFCSLIKDSIEVKPADQKIEIKHTDLLTGVQR